MRKNKNYETSINPEGEEVSGFCFQFCSSLGVLPKRVVLFFRNANNFLSLRGDSIEEKYWTSFYI